MVTLTLTSPSERALFGATDKLKRSVVEKMSGKYSNIPFVAFGPHEAQIYKLNEKYRTRMVIKCKLNKTSRAMFSEILSEFSTEREVSLAVDLNPISV